MKDIRDLEYSELEEFILSVGEKKFRAKQIFKWLWMHGVQSYDEMTDISVALRKTLAENFTFYTTSIAKETTSRDKSVKFLFQLFDNQVVEGVLIPQKNRVTACVSSQVGCPLGCVFCATGTMGFNRNLRHWEIFDEYILLNRKSQNIYNQHITNIVFMGMGEPLLNFENVAKSVSILTDKERIGLAPSRITISTAGIVKNIKLLADRNLRCGLAISLHSADPKIRREIMPVSEHNSLSELQTALAYFHKTTGERITVEYLLLSKINDSKQDAEKLARFCRAFPVKMNIIEYNETEGSAFRKSDAQSRENFVDVLNRCNMVVNVRMSKGQDIAAACGQLVRKTKESLG